MAKIVGMLKPFVLKQSFVVYEDGQKLDVKEATADEINDTIFALMEQYDINQIDFTGPKNYCRGISRRFEEAEMAKYSENKVKVNII